ncbi:MAG: hypothetical protein CSA65_01740 [Proteobacteria bacterium]|nr:MAG: hypothetical protein CSB49_05980 [Pseudomonadota bacterium]PIE19617.1 MAG: hypothetical protein CSA65_01740 [Pseudomonadota bacterium]
MTRSASARRVFLSIPLPSEGDALRLDGPDHHHLTRVLRLDAGAALLLVDSDGWAAEAEIIEVRKRELRLRLSPRQRLPAPPLPRLSLLHGVARGGRSELVLQKATELGVDRLCPVLCDRSVARPREAESKRVRWLEVVRQAARQSERTRLPEVSAPQPLSEALMVARGRRELRLVAALGGQPLSSHVEPLREAEAVTLLVGPEGGLTENEVALARREGFAPVSLGPQVLRSETAALTLLALVAFASGRLD